MAKPAKKPQKDLDIQIVVGIIGLVLSVVLHELFHIIVHWGHIQHISLFPNLLTIVQIIVIPGADANIEGEEEIAYGITILTALITAMIIYKIRDTNDERNTSQILFPADDTMQKLSPAELLDLSGLDEFGPEIHQQTVIKTEPEVNKDATPAKATKKSRSKTNSTK